MNSMISKCNDPFKFPAIVLLSTSILIFKCSPPPKQNNRYEYEQTIPSYFNSGSNYKSRRSSKLGGPIPHLSQDREPSIIVITGTTISADWDSLTDDIIPRLEDCKIPCKAISDNPKVQQHATKFALNRILATKQSVKYKNTWLRSRNTYKKGHKIRYIC